MNSYFRRVLKKISSISLFIIFTSCLGIKTSSSSKELLKNQPIIGTFILKSISEELDNEIVSFEQDFIISIDSVSISFNRSVNTCRLDLFNPIVSGEAIPNEFYCTEECCDDRISKSLSFYGVYNLYSNGQLEIIQNNRTYLLVRSTEQ